MPSWTSSSRRGLRRHGGAALVVAALAASLPAAAHAGASRSVAAEPPYEGTVFVDPDIVTPDDPSTFRTTAYRGQEARTMFDRRVDDWVEVQAHVFVAHFRDRWSTEVLVNPEFGDRDAAAAEANRYAALVGQLPLALRRDVDEVWIHRGLELFGGRNRSILIHTDQADVYESMGFLEEVLVHEAAHTSLDGDHAEADGWLTAQTRDAGFISTYARDNPLREDVAETTLLYLALRYRADRIDPEVADTIRATIPHRIAYLDRQGLDATPLISPLTLRSVGRHDGSVREIRTRSGRGGPHDADGTFLRVGDDARDRQYRSVLSFRTAKLPDGAVVTRLLLSLRHGGTRPPDTTLGGLVADVRRGGFGAPGLQRRDFQARAHRTVSIGRPPLGSGRDVADLTRARAVVHDAGPTQLRVRFRRATDADGTADVLRVRSGDAGRALRPRLIVQYGSR